MHKRILACLIFTIFSLIAFSQTPEDSVYIQESVIRLHLIPLGLCFENKIDNNKTILVDFGTGFSFLVSEADGKRNTSLKFMPYILIEPRIYTNLKERKDKGKRIDYYSGAYGAFKLQIWMNLSDDQQYIQLGPMVGFQRTLGKSGYWNIGIGVGSTIYEKDVRFGLIGDLKLGFILK